ncbi:L,D-transpeptidase family protein [Clostridium sartagoforme]|uniref:L,D-transpeptidase family protein n=1 Tax=Clostridium sartagoforme TaxID=84031 RepID=UPI001FA9FBA9|nr:L,D-transpeptidase family protein [Clostridium sartagoforme]
MRKKKVIISITAILSVLFLLFLSNSMYKSNKEKLKIETVENLIINGDYEEALEKINDDKDNENLISYKNLIEDFLNLRDYEDIEDKKEVLEIFKEKYKDDITGDIFESLNKDLSKIEESISNYYKEITIEKEKINKAIEEDIDSVGDLIKSFKEKYPKENITEIEDTYNKKLEEINNSIEHNNSDVTSENSSSPNITSNSNSNSGVVGIGSTNAAKNSSQIVTVVSTGGSYGELVVWEKDRLGNWIEVDRVAARLGQNGLKSASEVYEMDKCTPTGIYTLTEAFGINSNPGSGVTYRQLDGTEYWVDDENSQYYNTMQFGDPNGRWSSAEKLTDYPGYYNYSLVIDYNRWPVVPGKSSAIFIHCDMGIYTYGCVAIPQQNLVNLLKRLDPAKNPVVILDFSYDSIYNNY